MLHGYAEQHPGRIRILEPLSERAGACGNFSRLLRHSTAEYVAFSDQDDIWMPEKLAVGLEAMCRMEKKYGKATPLLIHSDLEVVDRNGKALAHSFWRRQRLDPVGGVRINRLLVQNVVTGSTILMNARLRDLSRSIPTGAIMHDWWIALIAAAFGRIAHLPCATVCYRQHTGNIFGSPGWGISRLCRRLAGPDQIRSSLLRTREQASDFLEQFDDLLTPEQKKMVHSYALLGREKFFARKIKILKYKFFKNGLIDNCAHLALG